MPWGDIFIAGVFSFFGLFALMMLYEGIFPKKYLVELDDMPRRTLKATTFWFVFQASIVAYAFYLYQEHTDRTATAGSAILVGAAGAGYFTFMFSKIADWLRQLSRRWRQPQRQR